MKIEEYKNFSWDLHAKAGHKPIVAQIELTYRCPLHCMHCYTDGFNNIKYKKDELSTSQMKAILDKCKAAGVIWLCFTGGDPMARKDFVELYLYAKKLGFIVTVFSSLTAMTEKILQVFKKSPPFNIETTLNAANKQLYEMITHTDFFDRHIRNIKKLIANDINVRVKTQVTKQNVKEINKIKKLIKSFGLDFRPSTMLFARLNHDTVPCELRLDPKEAVRINLEYGYYDEETQPAGERINIKDMIAEPFDKLFGCATGGHSFHVSPKGEMFLCSCLRKPSYDLLKTTAIVKKGFEQLNKKVHSMVFKTNSICRTCKYRLICKWCPGRALLEKGNLEQPIDYFCQLTKEIIKNEKLQSVRQKTR